MSSHVNKHGQSLRHLAVSNKCIFLDVIVPHLHKVLLPSIDISEIVDHLAGLNPEPLWVRVVLIVLATEDGVGRDRQLSCTGSKGEVRVSEYSQLSAGKLPEVIQSVVAADEGSLVLVRSRVFIILQLQEL